MTDRPAGSRRYSEEEMALILDKAVEGEPLALAEDGRTLAEIQEIAAEAGIDPARVQSAALALFRPRTPSRSLALGAPASYLIETTLPGRLAESEMPELISIVRRAMTRQGIVSQEFDSVQWKAADGFGARYVSIAPGEDSVHLRTMGNFRNGAFALFAPLLSIGGIVGVTVAATSGIVLAGPAIGLGAYLSARGLYGWLNRRERRRLDQLNDQLVQRLEEVLTEESESS